MATTSFKTWAVYPKAFLQARRVAALSKAWPKHERFALTDQIERSSRSVWANLAESFAKRRYPKHLSPKSPTVLAKMQRLKSGSILR